MKRILFVCHGNICRSPMAEFVMKDLVEKNGRAGDFYIESAATTSDDLGADMYPLARRKLDEKGIAHSPRRARKLRREDYDRFDHIYIMDEDNRWEIRRIFPEDPEHKIEFLDVREIEDPWYTRNFERVFGQIARACRNRFEELNNEKS